MKKTKNKYAVLLGKMRWEKYKGTDHEAKRRAKVSKKMKAYWAKYRQKKAKKKLSTTAGDK